MLKKSTFSRTKKVDFYSRNKRLSSAENQWEKRRSNKENILHKKKLISPKIAQGLQTGVIVQQSQKTKKIGPKFGKICIFLKLEQMHHSKTKFFELSGEFESRKRTF